MAEKINQELLNELNMREELGSAEDVSVIISLKDDVTLNYLRDAGLKSPHKFDLINAVSGTVSPGDVLKLARLPQVDKIELDSETTVY